MCRIFVITLSMIMMFSCTAYSSFQMQKESGDGYTVEYPLVYTSNKTAQNKINKSIGTYISNFKIEFSNKYSKTSNRNKWRTAHLQYSVAYEDDNLISLRITKYTYTWGAIHGYYENHGFVFEKNSGNRIPLYNFFRITLDDLKKCYSTRVYNDQNKPVNQSATKEFAPRRLTEDYYLLGNGGIALLYNPYELSDWASHATTIRFSREDVDYYNRKKCYSSDPCNIHHK